MEGKDDLRLESIEPVMPVDEIVALIPDRNGRFREPRERQRFTDVVNGIITLADEEADAQGVPRYTRDQRIVLVFVFFEVFDLFFGRKRRNGEDVWEDHLMAAVEVLIRLGGFRGVSKLATMVHHDTVEDLVDDKPREGESSKEFHRRTTLERQRLYGTLIDTRDLRGFLTEYRPELERVLKEEVKAGVRVMSKVKATASGKNISVDDAVFEVLLRALKKLPIVAVYKPCDIIVNGRTYGAVHSPEGVARKLEVARRYLTLVERLGMVEIAREMVWQRVLYLNPKLIEEFGGLREDRLRQRLDPFQGVILGKFGASDGGFVKPIVDVDFVPMDLYRATGEFRGNRDVAGISVGDLPIDFMDPMFEVLVLTQAPSPNPSDDQRRAAMTDAIAYIRWVFGSRTLRRFNDVMPMEGSNFEYRGATIEMFDAAVGGQLRFRVNDKEREARAKRGAFAPYRDTGVVLDEMRRDLRLVLDPNYRAMVLGTDNLVRAFEAKMSPATVGVYTPDGEVAFFPEGATVFDFGASVSPTVFAGMKWADIKPSLESKVPLAPVSPVDRLVPGAVYRIGTCLGERERFNGQVEATPAWYPFCGSQGVGYLAKTLSRLDVEDPEKRAEVVRQTGMAYLAQLSRIYKIHVQDLIDAVRQSAHKADTKYTNEDICRDVALGKCDPLLAVATIFDKKPEGIWEFCVELPHKAGSSADFFVEFSGEVGISIESYHVKEDLQGKKYLYCSFDLVKAGVSVKRFFHQMLRLSLKYKDKIELTKNPWMPLGVQDVYL